MTRSSHPWKALILAAGFGTRLLPHTRSLPKPLFTIDNEPLLDIIIDRLSAAGCQGVVVNTHHLAEKIERHCRGRRYDIPVRLSYEPEILGTGGAMKNNAAFFGDRPFLVINADIFTDIDLAAVRRYHSGHAHDVTLVMHDHDKFNTVAVDDNDHVRRFYRAADVPSSGERLLAFTGIHVIHPRVLDNIPEGGVNVDIIDVYSNMLEQGETIAACRVGNHLWHDIGTPEAYREVAFEQMSRQAVKLAFGDPSVTAVHPLAADGSDTRWYRISSTEGSLVACDRGIHTTGAVGEAESFTRINRHLSAKGVPVPDIFLSDPVSGLAFMQDLGDVNLQTTVRAATGEGETVRRLYHQVIDRLLDLAVNGAEGFNDAWTCQTTAYDRQVILDRECRYFTAEFISGYLGLPNADETLGPEFGRLADLTLQNAVNGLVHRDMQSRNIMIQNGQPFFIDAQGARRGPVQYDLAALLIDPYVNLARDMQQQLLDYYENGLATRRPLDRDIFRKGYACCAVTRNLQILGAFGFLTRQKQKPQFAPYIPAAAESLIANIDAAEAVTGENFPELAAVAEQASRAVRGLADHGPPAAPTGELNGK